MNQLIDSRELIPVLAATLALETEQAHADSSNLDILLTAVLKENDGQFPDIDHDQCLIALSDLVTERNAQTCQVHMDEADDEISMAVHYLSDLHGIALSLAYDAYAD